jgi:hypothetical protein
MEQKTDNAFLKAIRPFDRVIVSWKDRSGAEIDEDKSGDYFLHMDENSFYFKKETKRSIGLRIAVSLLLFVLIVFMFFVHELMRETRGVEASQTTSTPMDHVLLGALFAVLLLYELFVRKALRRRKARKVLLSNPDGGDVIKIAFKDVQSVFFPPRQGRLSSSDVEIRLSDKVMVLTLYSLRRKKLKSLLPEGMIRKE